MHLSSQRNSFCCQIRNLLKSQPVMSLINCIYFCIWNTCFFIFTHYGRVGFKVEHVGSTCNYYTHTWRFNHTSLILRVTERDAELWDSIFCLNTQHSSWAGGRDLIFHWLRWDLQVRIPVWNWSVEEHKIWINAFAATFFDTCRTKNKEKNEKRNALKLTEALVKFCNDVNNNGVRDVSIRTSRF